MKQAIKQDGGDVANIIKAEAKKEGVFLNELADRMEIPLHVFHRKIKKELIEVEFVREVLEEIKPGLKIIFFEEPDKSLNYQILTR